MTESSARVLLEVLNKIALIVRGAEGTVLQPNRRTRIYPTIRFFLPLWI